MTDYIVPPGLFETTRLHSSELYTTNSSVLDFDETVDTKHALISKIDLMSLLSKIPAL